MDQGMSSNVNKKVQLDLETILAAVEQSPSIVMITDTDRICKSPLYRGYRIYTGRGNGT